MTKSIKDMMEAILDTNIALNIESVERIHTQKKAFTIAREKKVNELVKSYKPNWFSLQTVVDLAIPGAIALSSFFEKGIAKTLSTAISTASGTRDGWKRGQQTLLDHTVTHLRQNADDSQNESRRLSDLIFAQQRAQSDMERQEHETKARMCS